MTGASADRWTRVRPVLPYAVAGLIVVVVVATVGLRANLQGLAQAPSSVTPFAVGKVTLGGGTVTALGSVDTVRPTANPTGRVGAGVVAARNEFESFQLVIHGGAAGLTNVDVSVAAGGTIPASWYTLYFEDSINLTVASDTEGGTGLWRDALVPKQDYIYGQARNRFPFNVPANENRVVWVDVLVPANQAADVYTGTLTVAAGASSAALPVSLTVLNLSLPSTTSLASAFLVYYDKTCSAHTGNALCNNVDGEQRWALQSLYARVALENRVGISNPWPLGVNSPPPTVGSTMRPYYDRYVLPLINGSALRDSANKWSPLRLSGARLTAVTPYWQCIDTPGCIAAWKSEAAASGFGDRLIAYACDELAPTNADCPTWDVFKSRSALANSAQPTVPILITKPIKDADANNATGLIDVIVPLINRLDDKSPNGDPAYIGNQRSTYNAFLGDAGNRLWAYTSCMSFGCSPSTSSYWDGWPGYAIDAPASQHRAMGWLAYLYDFSGELYWNATWLLSTAWTNQFDADQNGDGTLFYPGKACTTAGNPACIGGADDIPIESIRLKRIRDGREDYEWLKWLSSHGKASQATSIGLALFPNAYGTTQTAAAVESARMQLADLIYGIVGPTPGPTATPTAAPTAAPTVLPSPTILPTPTPTPLPSVAPVPDTTITAKPATRTNQTTASLTFTATVPGATFECSLDNAAYGACTSPTSLTGLTAASHSFSVRARTSGGVDATPAVATWTVDTTLPVTSAPAQTIVQYVQLPMSAGNVTIPTTFAWTGSDAGGVASYAFEQSTDKGLTWTPVTLGSPTATSIVRQLSPGSTYTFRVRATDTAGNVGAWSTGPNLLVAGYQEGHAAITRTGTWSLGTSTSYWGGNDRYATASGASMTFTVSNARTVAWISYFRNDTTQPHGKVNVFVDGVQVATIDLYRAQLFRGVAWSYTLPNLNSHTIKLVVLGTSGRPRVDVDAFVAFHNQ